MANVAIDVIDSMIKEYLIFRGFPTTLKSFEQQIKNDRNKSFKVDRILESFSTYIQTYDIVELRKYWTYFDKCFFSKLGYEPYKVIKKLENRVLRLYVVHALQNNKSEKVTEFFEKYVNELQSDDSWREWFVIPFIKSPEQNKAYAIYFTKIWQDSVMASLANCLNTICSNMALPKLLDFEKESKRLKHLIAENDKLKEQIMDLGKQLNQGRQCVCYVDRYVQTDEVDTEDDDAETTKIQKRSSSIKGRFPWKILGSKEKDSKEVQKNTSPSQQDVTFAFKKPPKSSPLDENIVRKSTIADGNVLTVVENNENNTIDNNIQNEKIQFQSDYYAAIGNSKDSDKGLEKTISKPEEICSSSNHNEAKQGVEANDSQSDAPFIILSQDEFTEHSSPIVSCRFSEDNNLVASLDLNGTFKVWQCYNGSGNVAQASTFTMKADILCLDWVPKANDKILIGKSNGLLSLLDISNKKTLWESCVHQKYKRIAHVNCSPVSTSAVCSAVVPISDLKKNAAASARYTSQQKLIKMKQYPAYNETGAARQGIISEWDLLTGQLKSELCLDPYPVYIHSMDYNHNGTLLVTGGADGMVRIFDIRKGDCLVGWHAHSTEILDVVFNPDETSIYSIAADGKVCVWDINKVSSKIAEFPLEVGCTGMHHYWISGDMGNVIDDVPSSKLLACDSEGQHMMTCGPSGLMIYRVKPKTTMNEAMHVLCPSSEVLTLDWTCSPNCSTVMCGTKQGIIQVSTLLKK